MYRSYEDPYKLEKELEDWLEQHPDKSTWDEYDYENYQNLKERINFAWQDDEYESNYMRENYPEDIYNATEVETKDSVEAGVVTGLINKGIKFLEKFFDSLDKSFDTDKLAEARKGNGEVNVDGEWNYMEVLTGGDYQEEQQKQGNYPFILGVKVVAMTDDYTIVDFALKRKGDDNSKAATDLGVKLSLKDDADIENMSDEEFVKLLNDTVQNSLTDEATKLLDKLGVEETVEDMQPIKLSTNLKVTLQKIVADDEIDVRLLSVDSPFPVEDTNAMLDAIVSDPDFVETLPEMEPTSYEVCIGDDCYDIEPCDLCEVDESGCILKILAPLYKLYFDCMSIHWNVTGPNYQSIVNLADGYKWSAESLIDQLSVEHYTKFGYAPHPNYFASQGDTHPITDAPIQILQYDIRDIINALELYYCNFDGALQQSLIDAKESYDKELGYTLARFE